MNDCPEEREDWVQELREAWPQTRPPLHVRPQLAPRKRVPTVWFWLPEVAALAAVVLFWAPWGAPPPERIPDEIPAWPVAWEQPQAPVRVGLRGRRPQQVSPDVVDTPFVSRRPDLRQRLQRANRRLNPNPIGS